MKQIVILVTLCALLVGCNQQKEEKPKYEMLNAGPDVYRLNTTSGEIVVFGRDGIQKYDDEYIRQRYQHKSALSDLKTDDQQTFPESDGQMWAKLKYKWRNDKILFQYTFGPYSDDLHNEFRNSSSSITLTFIDKDGFDVVSQAVRLDSLMRIVDETGNPSLWQKEGEISCSKDDYKLIEAYSAPWSFSKEVKSAIAKHGEKVKKQRQENLATLKKFITDGKILGKIEDDSMFLKTKDGFDKIEQSDHERIEFIVKNTELIRLLQGEKNEAEQGATPDR
jgi:hypothetical protein